MITISTDLNWFAVVAKPGKQWVAEVNLRLQGYDTFLPLCRRKITHDHQTKPAVRPLFDRYLFVGVGTEQRFDALWSTIGVAFVVTDRSGLACRVPVVALREIARRLDADGGVLDLVPPEAERPRWEPGLPLRVLEGPFREFTAIFQRPGNDTDVAQVLIDLFGRSMTLSVPVASLAPVDEEPAVPRRAGPDIMVSVSDEARAAVERLKVAR